VESLKSQLDLAKVNERDLNEIITALNDELSEKESQLEEALKLAEEAIQHYEEADLYSEQFYYDVSVMLRDALKEQLKEKNNA
jgi:hypothetical protein